MGRVRDAWDFVRYARIVRNASEYASVLPDYFGSSPAPVGPAEFSAVHTFVCFAGIGRSGTTLMGALLDAHPNMIIAEQQGVLKYVHPLQFSRQRIFHLLLRNSVRAARDGRPGSGGYTFAVPGQGHGRVTRIEVIGDKSQSAQTVEWLYSRPWLVRKLADTVRARIRIMHVVRNPFDTIARRSLRRGVPLERISRQYFALTEKMRAVKEKLDREPALDVDFILVHLEDLIADPVAQLTRICSELGVQPGIDYLDACAGIVYPKPSEPRKLVDWTASLRSDIERRIKEFDYLRRYSFGDEAGGGK
jgi:hypothetical protein